MTTTLLFLETRKINFYVVIKSSKKKKKRSTTVHMWSKTSDSGIALLRMILNDSAIFLRLSAGYEAPVRRGTILIIHVTFLPTGVC